MTPYKLPQHLKDNLKRAQAHQPALKPMNTQVKSSWERSARAGEGK